MSFFRDVVAHYVREHDVPEVDVAAALAVVLQGDSPCCWTRAGAARPPRAARAGDRGARAARADRPERRAARRPGDAPLATYRIAVGKRHKVEPRQIVGALANEGGLTAATSGRSRSGRTTRWSSCPRISPGTEAALAKTRISGKLIELRRDDGAPPRKPRHKG